MFVLTVFLVLILAAGASAIDIEDVQGLQDMQDDLRADYYLVNDIDASDTRNWNGGDGFDPIGGVFTGTLDGRGHTISNLHINRAEETNIGLFDRTNGATIENVRLVNVSITG